MYGTYSGYAPQAAYGGYAQAAPQAAYGGYAQAAPMAYETFAAAPAAYETFAAPQVAYAQAAPYAYDYAAPQYAQAAPYAYDFAAPQYAQAAPVAYETFAPQYQAAPYAYEAPATTYLPGSASFVAAPTLQTAQSMIAYPGASAMDGPFKFYAANQVPGPTAVRPTAPPAQTTQAVRPQSAAAPAQRKPKTKKQKKGCC
jgi:hypothetical protein